MDEILWVMMGRDKNVQSSIVNRAIDSLTMLLIN